jgi:hypothetical protein
MIVRTPVAIAAVLVSALTTACALAFEASRDDLVCDNAPALGEAREAVTALGLICIVCANAIAIGGCQYLSAQCESGDTAGWRGVQIPCWLVKWLGCTGAASADVLVTARCLAL